MKKNLPIRTLALALAMLVCLGSLALAELSRGDRGDEVARIQQSLIDLGYLNDVADGIFGKKTAAAVSAFQEAQGLPATGTVDDATQQALEAAAQPEATEAPAEPEAAETPAESEAAQTPEPAEAPADTQAPSGEMPIAVDEPVEPTATPEPTPEPTPTPVPLPTPAVLEIPEGPFHGLQVLEGCGWESDPESPGYAIGRNAAGEQVVYGIRLFNDGAEGSMTVLSVSWAPGVYREFADLAEAWSYCPRGVTSVSETSYYDASLGEDHLVAATEILLPDSQVLEGEQSVILFSGGHTAQLRVYLAYQGGYAEGRGWKIIPLGFVVDGVHEAAPQS